MTTFRTVLALVVLGGLLVASPTAAPNYSPWLAPANLGSDVNSAFNEQGPAVSKDGLSLYFGSDRPGGFGGLDIWVSQRSDRDAAWGPPVNLGATVNTADTDNIPSLSRDEHWLFFNSNRPGGFGGIDIWASYREHTWDDLAWQSPINVGSDVNSPFSDQAASYFANDSGGVPLLFFNSDRPGGKGLTDIYVSELQSDGSFGPASPVTELNSPSVDQRPSVRFDGLELFFFSSRTGTLGFADLWVAVRDTVVDPWSEPANLGPLVNSTVNDLQPYIAPDRRTLYFASNRAGGFGGLDLYVTTRVRQP